MDYQYSVVRDYFFREGDTAEERLEEVATFLEYSSAKAFALAIIKERIIPLPKEYGKLEIIKSEKSKNPLYGEIICAIYPETRTIYEKY